MPNFKRQSFHFMQKNFTDRLCSAQKKIGSLVCVGLDPDLSKIPHCHMKKFHSTHEAVIAFNQSIIRATAPFACAFKLNVAFYENLGEYGFSVLQSTLNAIPHDKIQIIDAKRGDIGNTASQYASSIFELLNADGCTVAPYMGSDAVKPFLAYSGRIAFVLIRTSNPSGDQLQSLMVDQRPLYQHVARLAYSWGEQSPGSVGFVVGATNPEELKILRNKYPTVPFLIPGIGVQGGYLDVVAKVSTPEGPVLVNNSRGILYASSEQDFETMAAQAAKELRDLLNNAIKHHAH